MLSRQRGTVRRFRLVDRRWRLRGAASETGMRWSVRYRGTWSWWADTVTLSDLHISRYYCVSLHRWHCGMYVPCSCCCVYVVVVVWWQDIRQRWTQFADDDVQYAVDCSERSSSHSETGQRRVVVNMLQQAKYQVHTECEDICYFVHFFLILLFLMSLTCWLLTFCLCFVTVAGRKISC